MKESSGGEEAQRMCLAFQGVNVGEIQKYSNTPYVSIRHLVSLLLLSLRLV